MLAEVARRWKALSEEEKKVGFLDAEEVRWS